MSVVLHAKEVAEVRLTGPSGTAKVDLSAAAELWQGQLALESQKQKWTPPLRRIHAFFSW